MLTHVVLRWGGLVLLALSFWVFARLSGPWSPWTRRALRVGIVLVLSGGLILSLLQRWVVYLRPAEKYPRLTH